MLPSWERSKDPSSDTYELRIGSIYEVMQQVGKKSDDKRLVCTVEMSSGGRLQNVPFVSGGIDFETEMPHGVFFPPRINQMVGVLFINGNSNNPIACFYLPQPVWNQTYDDGIKFFSSILDTVNDCALFHFSGSRIILRSDSTIEIAKKINNQLNSLKIEFKEEKSEKIITDTNNDFSISLNDESVCVKDKFGNEITLDNNGIKMKDKNNNTFEMKSGKVEINGLNLEVLQ